MNIILIYIISFFFISQEFINPSSKHDEGKNDRADGTFVVTEQEKSWLDKLKRLIDIYSINKEEEDPLHGLLVKLITDAIEKTKEADLYPLILDGVSKEICQLAEGDYIVNPTESSSSGRCQFYLSKIIKINNPKLKEICNRLGEKYSRTLFNWDDTMDVCKPNLYLF